MCWNSIINMTKSSSTISLDSIPGRSGSTPISSTMKNLVASLCLSFIVMTQANVIDDDMNVPPLKESFYVFEVISSAPVSDLKNCLSGVSLRLSFQVVGEFKYYFVAVRDTSKPPNQFIFPAGSMVTQYPAEHGHDFFQMEGFDNWIEADMNSWESTNNMMLVDYEIHIPPNTSKETFNSVMAAFASQYVEAQKSMKSVIYTALGQIPPKSFCFLNIDDNRLQYLLLDGTYALGGPGNVRIKSVHLLPI